MKSSEIIDVLCRKVGIKRSDNSPQFLSKIELLLILAHIEKLNLHISSLKEEVDNGRNDDIIKALLAKVGSKDDDDNDNKDDGKA